jgi:mannose-6-phosphate isomerase-like protein (cupin superfamily)
MPVPTAVIASTDTTGQQLRFGPGGGIYRILTTAAASNQQIFAFEAYEPPGGGPPLHIHRHEEEFFFVLEGEVTFFVDGQILHRTAGQTAVVPRGAAHCFKNSSDKAARLLVLFTPGSIEKFFDYGLPFEDGRIPPDEVLIGRIGALGPHYGLEVLGPSPL